MTTKQHISETPDKWVVLKITNELETIYKVFGSWAGGYTDGDRWKINSGISSVEEDADHYYFMGYSGSCYKCHKKRYGIMTSFSHSVLDNLVDKASEASIGIDILLDNINFIELLNTHPHENKK